MNKKQEIERINGIIKKEIKPLGKKHQAYCLMMNELCAFYEEMHDSGRFVEVISRIFDYGFVKGMRYCKRHGKINDGKKMIVENGDRK